MVAVDEPVKEAVAGAGDEVACSFCLRSTTEVTTMVAEPGVFICDTCVSICVELIETKPKVMPKEVNWEQEIADEDLLDLLPKVEAAGAQVERRLTLWVSRARSRGITGPGSGPRSG